MLTARGFASTHFLFLLIVASAVSATGWYVYNSNKQARGSLEKAAADVGIARQPARVIVAVGDIVCDPKDPNLLSKDPNYCQSDAVFELTKNLNPIAVLGLGDLQYEDGSFDKFQNQFGKKWGSFKKTFYPAPGNHEYNTPAAAGYYDYFKLNKPGGAVMAIDKGYYSFDLADWHFISLNSNCQEIGGCGENSEQIKWLEQDLKANLKSKCTLAFWHHPRFTSGRYSVDQATGARSQAMWARLLAYQADIVLNGHDHLYERFAPQTAEGKFSDSGIRQFTVGTGGKSHYKKQASQANSQVVIDDRYGVLQIELYLNAYRWQFKAIDGQVHDSGYDQCV